MAIYGRVPQNSLVEAHQRIFCSRLTRLAKSTMIFSKVCILGEIGWLVGCFGLSGPLRQYFSLYRAVSQRDGERGEKR